MLLRAVFFSNDGSQGFVVGSRRRMVIDHLHPRRRARHVGGIFVPNVLSYLRQSVGIDAHRFQQPRRFWTEDFFSRAGRDLVAVSRQA